MKIDNYHKCCICGLDFLGYGNNAEPIKSGICCDDCNRREVLPARMKQYNESLQNK